MNKHPHEVNTMAAQGDLIIRRVAGIPKEFSAVQRDPAEPVVVAHSETGHNHAIHAEGVIQYEASNPLICYLQITDKFADLVHHRAWDTHGTLRLSPGNYQVKRAREYTPEGWRRVED
jgi:hypothetical protein